MAGVSGRRLRRCRSRVPVWREHHSVEAMQCGICTRDLQQPIFAYRPFETGSKIHWRPRGDCTVVSLQQSKRSMLFEKCGNLYQIYWSNPNCPFKTGLRIHWRSRGIIVSLQHSKMSMLFEKCGNQCQIYGSRPNIAGSAFIVVNDANESYRYDKLHVVTRRVDKQDVTTGELPDKTRQATRTGRGRQRAGWRVAGKDTRYFAVTGVTFWGV